ncbi:MAG TPA: protein TolR [Methylococcaceae bacterium]|nr:protein TolR [Methylococcaceae bacterium]HIN68717.1 protein TolR [Methylococcales bacterium]HIA45984.1 protein TolR [Methylococcaceae bacterium]HIB62637.1 protein TolR [Methylococcaceae bacterium]HIO12305.1 protein TolR [Methylococcales bacterium]
MRRLVGRRKPMAEINVVPYIDVTLVLLIIFMVTAPLLQTGVEVDLPKAQAKTVAQDNTPPTVVSIDKDGQYFLSIGGGQDELVTAEELLIRVAAVLRYKPETKVLIRGDESVNYGRVVNVMAALKKANVPSVGLMTSPYNAY